MNTVILTIEKFDESMDDIKAWLKDCGDGIARYGGRKGEVKHWLGTDDWCCYDEWDDNGPKNTVFLFRRESDAVEFALRFV